MNLSNKVILDYQEPFVFIPTQLVSSPISAEAVRIYALLSHYGGRSTDKSLSLLEFLAEMLYCTIGTAHHAVEELRQTGWITVVGGDTYQLHSSPKQVKSDDAPPSHITQKCDKSTLREIGGQSAIINTSSGQAYPKKKGEKVPKAVRNARRVYCDAFERFWQEYPRHVGKAAAYDVWLSLVKSGIDPGRLLQATRNYAESCRVDGTEKKFIKHASSFLNGVWMDYQDGITEIDNPQVIEIVAHYQARFREEFGSEPLLREGRDSAIFERILRTYTIAEIKALLNLWFDLRQDRFLWRTGDVPAFAAVYNELLSRQGANHEVVERTPEDVTREEQKRLQAALARVGSPSV